MKNEINNLREAMKSCGLGAYMVKVGDPHMSEGSPAHYRFLEHLSGFTGSRALLIVTMDDAGLWTDSRYFIQAEIELSGTGITLYKEGKDCEMTPLKFLLRDSKDLLVGFDGKMFSKNEIEHLFLFMSSRKSIDLADIIWNDRPSVKAHQVRRLDNAVDFSGMNSTIKLEKIRESMRAVDASFHIVQTLDDIAWILNLRGGDIPYTPVFYSNLLVGLNEAWLFAYEEAFSSDIKDYLKSQHINLLPYENFYEYFPNIIQDEDVMIDSSLVSYDVCEIVSSCAKIVEKPSPSITLKAQKNETEIDEFRTANIIDGVAMCKFLCWVKSGAVCTELSATEKLFKVRKELGASSESFETIMAYGSHGAIVHYAADTNSNAVINPSGFLLVDSGAHYEGASSSHNEDISCACGTTDITRTIAMGPLTDEMKLHYTLVLMGHIDYAMAVFPHGTRLEEIDSLAHSHLLKHGLNYYHGTSHGIGHVLSVHESLGCDGKKTVLKKGMIMSDEPGVYIEGSHGVRIEGDILCIEKDDSLGFEMLTLCPYEKEAILQEMLTKEQRDWINDYHEKVRTVISPYLDGEELKWLTNATKKI